MIVVTGPTGNVGSALVDLLAADGEKVTTVSRNPSRDARVRHVVADLAEPASLAPAFDGADALFLLITGAQLTGGPAPRRLLDIAASGGVRRVVFLSSQGVVTRPESAGYARSAAFEEAIAASGLEWTALRPSGFFTNTLAWADAVRGERTVAAPFGDVGLPVIDPADIAAVAAATLREDGHGGLAYTLTGPELITPRGQAAALATALGAEIGFVELSREQARAGLLRFMPESVADHTLDILGTPTAEEQRVGTDVEKVIGRSPAAYADWARRYRAAFA